MSLNIAKYHVLLNPVHLKIVEPISQKKEKEIESCIDELAYVLEGDFDWVLTGGLAIPLTIGEFYRVHRDIDIGVAQDDLDALVQTAHEHGYGFFKRVFMTKFAKKTKIDVYSDITPVESADGDWKHLRLVKLDAAGHPVRHMDLLDYIDVYVHHFEDGELVANDGSVKIPAEMCGGLYETISGKNINLRPLEYIARLKQRNHNDVNRHDMQILDLA